MKSVAIIGTGLTGLRAGLELVLHSDINLTLIEKSRSVGGRVATRRFEDNFINHGALAFDDAHKVVVLDSLATAFTRHLSFAREATALPKALKDLMLHERRGRVNFQFNTKVMKVESSGRVSLENGDLRIFDHVLITAPIPQAREMLGSDVLPEVTYNKRILFIGLSNGLPYRHEMPVDWSEAHFELSESEIRALAQEKLQQELSSLDLKKWRYAEVRTGHPTPCHRHSRKITLAGDAFDPSEKNRAAAAWLSGFAAGTVIRESLQWH